MNLVVNLLFVARIYIRDIDRERNERIKEDTVGTRKTDGFIILLRHRERATPTSHETMKRVTGI